VLKEMRPIMLHSFGVNVLSPQRISGTVVILAVLVGLAGAGCGKSAANVAVKGKVVLAGMAVPEARIIFWPKNSREKQVEVFTDSRGAFEMNCPPGTYKVTVQPLSKSVDPAGAASGGPIKAPNLLAATVGSSLPRNVQDPVQTPLKLDVPAGGVEDVVLKLDQ
jgi:hypothetical protein